MKKKLKLIPQYRRLLAIITCGIVLLTFGGTKNYGYSQERGVSGIILDQSEQPIIGASIIEKGTQNGVYSDINGKF